MSDQKMIPIELNFREGTLPYSLQQKIDAFQAELELARKIQDEAIKQTEILTEEVNVWKPAAITKQLEIDALQAKLDVANRSAEYNSDMFDCLKIDYDALRAKLEVAVDEMKAIRNRAVISPGKTDYELIRMVDTALAEIAKLEA